MTESISAVERAAGLENGSTNNCQILCRAKNYAQPARFESYNQNPHLSFLRKWGVNSSSSCSTMQTSYVGLALFMSLM
jgi:hypothetical protein